MRISKHLQIAGRSFLLAQCILCLTSPVSFASPLGTKQAKNAASYNDRTRVKIGAQNFWLGTFRTPDASVKTLETAARNYYAENNSTQNTFPCDERWYCWTLTTGTQVAVFTWGVDATSEFGWIAIDRQPGAWRIRYGGSAIPDPSIPAAATGKSFDVRDGTSTYVKIGGSPSAKLYLKNPFNVNKWTKEDFLIKFSIE